MQQQIKVVRWYPGSSAGAVEAEIQTAWEAATSPEGVRPALEAVYPLGEGLVLLVFSGDLARASILPQEARQEVEA